MKTPIAILGGKLAGTTSKMIGRNGNNIPGVVARKVDSDLLRKLAAQVKHIVFVTGTNGKTTVSNLLTSILRADGKKVLSNSAGDNLITGITAAFLKEADWKGKIPYDYAVIEVDELTTVRALKEIQPEAIVVNNFFRDQLERIGEIDILVDKIAQAIKPVQTSLVLNADDPFVARLGELKKNNIFYGLHKDAFSFVQFDVSESKFCHRCGTELLYNHVHYGQLGYFECTCGFKRPAVTYEIEKIHQMTSVDDRLAFNINGRRYTTNLLGYFNVYNILAAVAGAQTMNVSEEAIQRGLDAYHSENGRMQLLDHKEYRQIINLVKNPAGVNITLSEVLQSPNENRMVFFLNDLQYDARDISWIYDADFERMAGSNLTEIVCSGTRAYDIALRMKYAGIDEKKLVIRESKEEAITYCLENPKETYFLPTYTALEPVRKYLEYSLK